MRLIDAEPKNQGKVHLMTKRAKGDTDAGALFANHERKEKEPSKEVKKKRKLDDSVSCLGLLVLSSAVAAKPLSSCNSHFGHTFGGHVQNVAVTLSLEAFSL